MMERVICLAIGYVCGLFQTSYIIGKIHHTDIREHGSGNAGTTNALRTFGKKAGALTLLGDMLKCVAAAWIARAVFGGRPEAGDILPLLEVYAAAGCVLGHNFPFYLNFRGGKGVAASAGMLLAVDWRVLPICAAVFFGLFFATHYVSLGSICAYLTGFLILTVFGQLGMYGMDSPHTIEMDIVIGLMTVLAIYRHRSNISRLLAGKENKTYLNKSKK